MEGKIEKVREYVLEEIRKSDGWNWEAHILGVTRNGKELAREVGADLSVVELSCLLHDIAKIRGDRIDHHLKGAEMAGGILAELGFDAEIIDKVKECIVTHSSDEKYPPKTLEQKVVASADALSHFDMFFDLCRYVFQIRGMGTDEGKAWLRKKYTAAWKKLIPPAREKAKKRRQAILFLLES